jgi:predicted acylesterase/phospholipase RssA
MTGTLGLVLSGGFLRNAFQVGVIEALHAHGVRFGLVAGVSSGAWNAACIATGQIHEMREFWLAVARAPKLRWRNVWRYATPSNFPEIVRSVPMRKLRFDQIDSSRVRLRIGATSVRERRLHWFESWNDREAFFDTLMASNYLPGVYGPPIRINGHYYADGSFVDNVPYEVALEAGCERALVVVSDPRGRIWKRLLGRGPHEVPAASRPHLVVIHPEAPLPIGRIRSTPDDVLRCIDIGHRAAEKTLAEQPDLGALGGGSCADRGSLGQSKEKQA